MDKLSAQSQNKHENLVIKIVMKKLEIQNSSGAGSSTFEHSNDTNNNEGIVSKKKESAAKEFCKNLFNKASGDRINNNSQVTPPVTNQYTKVTVDGLSQLSLQNHQNSSAQNQADASKR